ncbi:MULTISPECIES: type I-MYXAN CRISPR-associated protein Cas6/Cmx6 [unclassified Coleofasciculus]|uniref:type I-MYXAN CRISPR-associated protein Cas6/Cmx6 n=1 Tax=unclassified Coleofasciculus TaxID=2692782 RepID=UPI00187E77AB|nr:MULTISPECIES: type I-MYXAN CRISPR-associated protein Cas6/Cmx6 [unclassified Coleofasciculus]MBE9125501.1 type I-MYXAN CRISPR-associated protein Cas6/Cmx6 [Coleofasciculus sp. LEGE 07081]MBE9148635.1 type I-MYXAN CRISPR-associated protein Cas6/Cmx6 [Coleofasciculus sp. LEGE 07092]
MTSTTIERQPGASPIELFVNLSFSVKGQMLPADHGYGLFAALSKLCPSVHEDSEIQILTIPGIPDRKGKIALTDRSRLLVRLPVTKIPLVYAIAGKRLLIGNHPIQIGIPNVEPLRPKAKLRSRIVVIKPYTEPESFLGAAQRQLETLEVSAQLRIPLNIDKTPKRKTIKIQRYTVVGFTTEVTGLSAEDSLKLQQWGLGGKRRMGCGVFL